MNKLSDCVHIYNDIIVDIKMKDKNGTKCEKIGIKIDFLELKCYYLDM